MRQRAHLHRQHALRDRIGDRRVELRLGERARRLIEAVEHLEVAVVERLGVESDLALGMADEGEYLGELQERRVRPLARVGFGLHRRATEQLHRCERELDQRLQRSIEAFRRRALWAVQRHRLGAEARELHPHVQVEPAVAHVVAGEQVDQRLEGFLGGRFRAEIDGVDHRANTFHELA